VPSSSLPRRRATFRGFRKDHTHVAKPNTSSVFGISSPRGCNHDHYGDSRFPRATEFLPRGGGGGGGREGGGRKKRSRNRMLRPFVRPREQRREDGERIKKTFSSASEICIAFCFDWNNDNHRESFGVALNVPRKKARPRRGALCPAGFHQL